MTEPSLQWTTPAPLWPEAINGDGNGTTTTASTEFLKPAILRFTSDGFMDEFLNLLEHAPTSLDQLRTVPETWRGLVSAPAPIKPLPLFRRSLERRKLAAQMGTARAPTLNVAQTAGPELPLKLYQPAHMRYYLLAACLVCQVPGLPDRLLNTTTQERVSFVVRRLQPKTPTTAPRTNPGPSDEYAFVTEGRSAGWRKVDGNGKSLQPGEEQLPLFPATFTQTDGRKRRLFAGLIPVGKRETYMGAGELKQTPPTPPTGQDGDLKPGQLLFLTQVIEPWKRLVELANAFKTKQTVEASFSSLSQPPGFWDDEIKATREQIQVTSWYILLDFAGLLQQYLPDVWQAITTNGNSAVPEQNALINELRNTQINDTYADALWPNSGYQANEVLRSLAAALAAMGGGIPPDPKKADEIEADLEGVTAPFVRGERSNNWPDFLFPLADPENEGPLPPATGITLPDDPLEAKLAHVDNLGKLIASALPAQSNKPAPALPLAAQPVMDTREGWFQLRCIFEQPNCDPRLVPALVSEPTAIFQMAGFFDPDAPARPIRIGLPIDTTPAGLRKFDKNTAFMISDVLCGQINRAKGLTLGDLVRSVLPWPLHKDLSVPDPGPCTEGSDAVGMICSLSIPIITICALILLIVIVSLLDIIFHWIPYFILCFPLPKFSAKGAS